MPEALGSESMMVQVRSRETEWSWVWFRRHHCPVRVLVPTALVLSDASGGPLGIPAPFLGLKAAVGAPWPSVG